MAPRDLKARSVRTDPGQRATELSERLADPEEVRAHLLAAASAGHALTYAELLEKLGYGFSRPKMRALCAILGSVDDDAARRDEPELAMLVVRQSDGLPGQGWWIAGGAAKHGHVGTWEGREARLLIERLQKEAFAFWGRQPK